MSLEKDIDNGWIILCAFFVFIMQLGFALLEFGSVEAKNALSILLKNVVDVSISGFMWFAWGYSLSRNTGNSFVGTFSHSFTDSWDEFPDMFFGLTFAAASSTIASGAVSGRMRLTSYIFIPFLLSLLVYPILSHWVWASNGWLYKWGFIDFAGSGVVHLCGGVAGITASAIIGPRKKFMEEGVTSIKGHSLTHSLMGTMLLWIGWFGFNAGSTKGITGGKSVVAGICSMNTALAPAASLISYLCFDRLRYWRMCFYLRNRNMNISAVDIELSRSHTDATNETSGRRYPKYKIDFEGLMNSILGGLVAVTAGCATMRGWGAIITGIFAGPIMGLSSMLIKIGLRIDDPVDAFAVHGACGMLGLIMAAILCDQEMIDLAYGTDYVKYDFSDQLGKQIAGGLAIAALPAVIISIPLWLFMLPPCRNRANHPFLVRVTPSLEEVGTDDRMDGWAYFYLNNLKDQKNMQRSLGKRLNVLENRGRKGSQHMTSGSLKRRSQEESKNGSRSEHKSRSENVNARVNT